MRINSRSRSKSRRGKSLGELGRIRRIGRRRGICSWRMNRSKSNREIGMMEYKWLICLGVLRSYNKKRILIRKKRKKKKKIIRIIRLRFWNRRWIVWWNSCSNRMNSKNSSIFITSSCSNLSSSSCSKIAIYCLVSTNRFISRCRIVCSWSLSSSNNYNNKINSFWILITS